MAGYRPTLKKKKSYEIWWWQFCANLHNLNTSRHALRKSMLKYLQPCWGCILVRCWRRNCVYRPHRGQVHAGCSASEKIQSVTCSHSTGHHAYKYAVLYGLYLNWVALLGPGWGGGNEMVTRVAVGYKWAFMSKCGINDSCHAALHLQSQVPEVDWSSGGLKPSRNKKPKLSILANTYIHSGILGYIK